MAKAKSAFTDEDDALLDALGVESEVKKAPAHTPREERIIAGFEEVQRFVEQSGRLPSMADGNDIFERLYATRLEQLRKQQECRDILVELDHQGLLGSMIDQDEEALDALSDDALLEELGVATEVENDLTNLQHVKSSADKKAAEEIANRDVCKDFERFKPLFDTVQQELTSGARTTRKFEKKAEISPGRFFVLGGLKAYVAEMEEPFVTAHGMTDARLRVIFDNGTESNMLQRSLQRALHKDEAGRRITDPSAGPLFADAADEEDTASGTIYVLRSKSDNPKVVEHRQILHKIGVTGGDVDKRVANAAHDATFLLADVEIVATYQLYNIHRSRFERLIHKLFEAARLDITIPDRFGTPVQPREWFLVPFAVIEDAINKIIDGTISDYTYDRESATLVQGADRKPLS